MDAILRKATRADVPQMQVVRAAVKENQLVSMVIGDEEVIRAIEETGRGWVIEADGEVVGFGIANRETRSIWSLFLHPDHERKGYGRQIFDAMTDWLWNEGDSPIWLSTDPGTRAEKFYLAAGWTITGTLSNGEVRFEKTGR